MFSVSVSRVSVVVLSLFFIFAVSVTAQVEVPEGLEPILIDGFEGEFFGGDTQLWGPGLFIGSSGEGTATSPHMGDPFLAEFTKPFVFGFSPSSGVMCVPKFWGPGLTAFEPWGIYFIIEDLVGGLHFEGMVNNWGSSIFCPCELDTPTHFCAPEGAGRLASMDSIFDNSSGTPGMYRMRIVGNVYRVGGGADHLLAFAYEDLATPFVFVDGGGPAPLVLERATSSWEFVEEEVFDPDLGTNVIRTRFRMKPPEQ